MRLALTVVAPATRFRADVVIDADPATPVADVAAELESCTNTAFREAEISIDGTSAGVAPVYP